MRKIIMSIAVCLSIVSLSLFLTGDRVKQDNQNIERVVN